MNEIQKQLLEIGEEEYAEFASKLTPTLPRERFIGIRIPVLRKYAKTIRNTTEANTFLKTLDHYYYEEQMLHGFLIAEIKDFDACLAELNRFLPYINNWAVCDTLKPACFKKHRSELIESVRGWCASERIYTARYGIVTLMDFLGEDFRKEYLELAAGVMGEDYYIRMAVAWFFATALAKQWDATLPYIEGKRLDKWTHNKAIQKARESYRVSEEQKAYLKTLKI